MAHHLPLIHDNEADREAPDDRRREEHRDVLRYTAHPRPTSTSTTVREDGLGVHLATDGPYAGTKEALGGFHVIDVPDLDAALAAARRLPHYGAAVEARLLYHAG